MGGAFVMLDPERPWTPPPDLLDSCVRRVVADGVVVAVVIPVTDTVKEIVQTPDGAVVGATHDREGLRRLVTLVVPEPVEAADLVEALADVRSRYEVVMVLAAR